MDHVCFRTKNLSPGLNDRIIRLIVDNDVKPGHHNLEHIACPECAKWPKEEAEATS